MAAMKPDLICLADVEPRHVEWLWEPFIPARMISLLSGEPGAGKSYIALGVAAELSRGRLLDHRTIEPANTLYLTCENPIAECIRPRFDSLGGDPARLMLLQGLHSRDENGAETRRTITLGDVDALDAAIRETGARLVIVDPLQSYLGASVDLHRANETRPVMDGLARLADVHGCAILLLRHLNKQTGGKAINRGLGSIDLTGASRSELIAGSLPDDPDTRALVHVKANVGRTGRALGFTIDAEGRFAWTGESSLTAADLLAAPAGPGDHKLAEACRWLTELLRPAEREQKEVRELAEAAGISIATLRRAKNALGVRSCKPKGGMKGAWLWALPEDAQAVQTEEFEHLPANVSTFDKTKKLSGIDPARTAEGAHTREMSTFESECGGLLQ